MRNLLAVAFKMRNLLVVAKTRNLLAVAFSIAMYQSLRDRVQPSFLGR